MLRQERRALLLERLRINGFLQMSEVAEKLSISTATIRRDLDQLEKEGLCQRTRGGAITKPAGVSLEIPYEVKRQSNDEEKRAIAFAASKFIEDGDSVILDAGSTTFALADLLYNKKRLTVVTNDLKIAIRLAANPNICLICTGGIARPNVFSLQGMQVTSLLDTLHVDKAFLGADAIHPDGIVANVNIEEVALKRSMIKAGRKVFLLADASKFSHTAFATVCHLNHINFLLTNAQPPVSHSQAISDSSAEIVIV